MASSPTNIDHLGYNVVITENEYMSDLYNFTTNEEVHISTGALYFLCRTTNKNIIRNSIKKESPEYKYRKPELVNKIYNTIFCKWGYQSAKSRLFITSINDFEKQGFSIIDILKAVDALDITDVKGITMKGCLDKEECIKGHLMAKLYELKAKPQIKKAA